MQSGYVRVSPFLLRKVHQWIRSEPSRRPRQHVSQVELARLLTKARDEIVAKRHHKQASEWAVWRCHRLAALVSTIAHTGCRKNEALHLQVVDVDLQAGFISIVDRAGSRLKTLGSARRVPIAPALAEDLRGWIPQAASEWLFPNTAHDGPWQGGSPGHRPLDRLKALGARSGIRDLTFLALRHSFATHAQAWGWSPGQIARVMGHTTIRTQNHYIHHDDANLRESAKLIDFGQAGGAPQ
jgi:integrase